MSNEVENIELKTNQVLTKYINELNSDIKLNEYNLREKCLTCSSMWSKWISYLFLEKENLQRIADAKQKIIKNKMAENKNIDSVLRMKSEEKITNNDENIKKLNVIAKQTQDNIDFIERALNIFANFGFNIKNSIEVLKLSLSH